MALRATCAALGLALVCVGCGPQLSLSAGTHRGWADPGYDRFGRTDRGVWLGLPGYARSPFDRSAVVCDRLGRCWRRGLDDRFDHGDFERRDAEPPGWAERLPGSARDDDRFLRPRSNLVCDRATRICYKDGEVDKSDTESVFGERAGDRADDLRDRHGTARLFAPERGVSCDRERRRCFEDGDPDRQATRRYFGRRAARNLD
jgi:hypothetical protein